MSKNKTLTKKTYLSFACNIKRTNDLGLWTLKLIFRMRADRIVFVVDKAASITSLLSDTTFYNWAVWLNHNRALFDGSIKLFVFARWMILYFNIFLGTSKYFNNEWH